MCTRVCLMYVLCGPVVTCTHPCLCKCKARAPSPRKPACCQVAEGEKEGERGREREQTCNIFFKKKPHNYNMLSFFFPVSLRTVYAGKHQTGALDCTDWLRGCRSTATIFLALELDLNYNVIKVISEICDLLCFCERFLNCTSTR